MAHKKREGKEMSTNRNPTVRHPLDITSTSNEASLSSYQEVKVFSISGIRSIIDDLPNLLI